MSPSEVYCLWLYLEDGVLTLDQFWLRFCLVAIVIDLVLIGLMTIWLLSHQLDTWSKLSCTLLLICTFFLFYLFLQMCTVLCHLPARAWVSCTIMGFGVLHHHGFWVSCTITGLGVLHRHRFGCLAPSRVWVSCTITGVGILHQLRCNCVPWWALTISLSAPVFYIMKLLGTGACATSL